MSSIYHSLRLLTESSMLACMLFPGLLKTGRRAGRMRSRYSSCVHSFTRNSTGSRTAARTSCERTSCSRIGQMCWNHSFWRKKIRSHRKRQNVIRPRQGFEFVWKIENRVVKLLAEAWRPTDRNIQSTDRNIFMYYSNIPSMLGET